MVLLVLFISVLKLQPFISFLLVSLGLGLASGLTTGDTIVAIQKGIGGTLGSIIPIIILGAMIGKMVAKSQATTVIADWLVDVLGQKNLPFAFMIIGFIVGLPLFYSVAFLLMAPLVLSTAQRHNLPVVYLGIPMLASLSITQGFLPPHPAPYYLVTHLPGADMGITLGLGIVISIPAMLASGWLFGKTLKNIPASPMSFVEPPTAAKAPSLNSSLFVLLLPVGLIAMQSFAKNLHNPFLEFVGEPIVALLISLGAALYLLGFNRGISWSEMQGWLLESIKDISPLMLTFGGAGAFKEILQAMKVGDEILKLTQQSTLDPLIIAWMIAGVLRIVTGSSTVAGITTAGLILPILSASGANPNLMALSIGAGSMVLSHVNDAGFWLYKEYFGVTIKDSLRSWTIMETILAVVGLLGVLVLQNYL
ncbi:MAG: gluconate transporter [Cytophagales bacterium]|nr:gluconate transporter [Cytophagales bacterium]